MNNFIKRIRTKGIIILFMLVLSSCGKEEETSVNDNDINKVNQQEDGDLEAPSLTMEDLRKDYPDKKILVWAYDNALIITPSVNKALNSALVDKGYEFVILFEELDVLVYEDSIDKMIEEGNSPDIICGGLGDAGTLQGTYRAVKKEWLLELDSYLDTEEGKALKDIYPEKMWKAFDVNGHVYGVNGLLPYNTDFVYYVNKELADKYNISLEQLAGLQPSELEDILDIVYQGEKAKDFITYIYEENYRGYYSTVSDVFNNSCNAMVFDNRLKSPKATNVFAQEDQIEYFTSLAKYREKGYLTVEEEELEEDEKIKVRNFFIIQSRDDAFGNLGEGTIQHYKDNYPMVNEVDIVPFDSTYITLQGNGVTGICKHSKQKDLAFQAIAAVYTDKELSDLLLYGIEGEDYQLKDERVVINNNNNNYDWFRGLYFGNSIISTPTDEEPINKKEIIFDKVSQMEASDMMGTYVELDDIIEDINKINAVTNKYAGLFDGEFPDVEDTIQKLNSELEEADFQLLLDEINHRYLSARE